MIIKGKKDIEYWITKSRSGVVIRVYRIDPLKDPKEPGIRSDADCVNYFTVPIMVEFMGRGESIAEIIEERDKLKEEKEYAERQVSEARRELFDYQTWHPRKRWCQFWK